MREVAMDRVSGPAAASGAMTAPLVEIIEPPYGTDEGSREYQARDCASRLWSFGTYRP
jgi:hypothetical protein